MARRRAAGPLCVAAALIAISAQFSFVTGLPGDQHVLEPAEDAPVDMVPEGAYEVRQELKKAEIIPNVIDDFLPTLSLIAEWSHEDYTSLGNVLKPGHLQDAPKITLHNPTISSAACRSRQSYAVALTDPDAPSRQDPKWSEMCHWIAAGRSTGKSKTFQGGCNTVSLAKLEDIVPYKAPGPPPKTGKHRYVFFVFAPANGTTDYLNLTQPDDRQHWGTGKVGGGVRSWARDNGLVPVAANFIYAQNKEQ